MNLRNLLFASFLVLVALLAVACGGDQTAVNKEVEQNDSNTNGSGTNVNNETNEEAESSSAGKEDWPTSMTMGTASVGGAYHIYGSGVGDMISEATGVDVSIEVTDGPNHNILLIEGDEIELGMVTVDLLMKRGMDWKIGQMEINSKNSGSYFLCTPLIFIGGHWKAAVLRA